MTNLLAETIHAIIAAHQTTDTVRCVRSQDGEYAVGWSHFANNADVEYDSGYGSAEVATDLIVEFNDGTYLERDEYDGAEGWVYVKPLPPLWPSPKTIDKAVGALWPTVAELNNPNEWEQE